MHISKTESNSLSQPSDAVAEISLEEFSRVLKVNFFVYSEPVPGRPYCVRYTGSPYDHGNENCKSMQISAHDRGTRVSPLVIISVLGKFEIAIPDYLEALSGQGKLVPIKPRSSGSNSELDKSHFDALPGKLT